MKPGGDRQAQLDALASIEQRAAALNFTGQFRVVTALKDAASSAFILPEVRAKALLTLGKAAAWFSDWTARKQAAEALLEAATVDRPSDPRWEERPYGWRGLASVAGKLERGDDSLAQSIVEAVLKEDRDGPRGQERTMAMLVLSDLLQGSGPGVVYREPGLAQRVEDQFLSPLENGGVDRLCSDSDRGADYRYLLVRSLYMMSWVQPDLRNIRQRTAQVLEDLSRRDPSSDLRQLAHLYAQNLRR